ncbi:hypothetical protein PORY_000015 [Pneumocystis oryctolagi]|uniref:Uncharacterized protein n=1 Tax=Pneumocystis oryctolagi TaxID=42067 RepID=A0ACB7CH29_9ASCO|nr:hypothetical protein PORY_000015 [Pneumocystis oryctolagi]
MSFSTANQTVILKTSHGDKIGFLLSDFDAFSLSRAQTSMIFSAQCAMSALLALVLLLTSKREKAKTLLFFLNIGGLTAVFIRACLQCAYLSGTWTSYSVQFLGEFELLSQSDFYISVIASCMPIFIILFIELSLLTQIRVIYATHKKLQTFLTIIFSIMTIIVITFWVISAVQNSVAILSQTHFGNRGIWGAPWPYTAARISFAFSISTGCIIFVLKLFSAIYRRHKMGLKEFGPIQIIFIMSCQTLIIPTIFVIIDFWLEITGFSSLTQAFVVMSLPLSSLWASSKVERNKNSMMQSYSEDLSSRNHSIRSSPTSLNKSPMDFKPPPCYMDSKKSSYASPFEYKDPFDDQFYENNGSKLNVFIEKSINVSSEEV